MSNKYNTGIARNEVVARQSRSKLGDSSLRSEQAPQSLYLSYQRDCFAEPVLSNKTRFFANAQNDNSEGARDDTMETLWQDHRELQVKSFTNTVMSMKTLIIKSLLTSLC
jgi:hypothetical protein